MKTMKYILAVIVLIAAISLTTTDAVARSHHGHSSFSIGIYDGGWGFGYGYGYRGPHYWRYYGYPYYPYYDYPVVVERPVVIAQPAPIIVQQAAPVQVYVPPVERLADGRVKSEVASSQPAVQTAAASSQTTVIWIKNDNGSQTPVTLRQQGAGYIGPQNEYYSTLPTEEQLKPVYGLKSNAPPANTVTILLNNSDGTKTPITLKKEGTNYIGPAGEIYTALPTEEQLKQIYGK
ncbi:MAG: hypothetical protein ACYC3B_08480 [Sedimentisphaerales bacterium]